MSVTDPVILTMAPEYEKTWALTRGRETFYDEESKQRRWHAWQEAVEWCKANLGVSPLDHLPEGAKAQAQEKLKEPRQKRLL